MNKAPSPSAALSLCAGLLASSATAALTSGVYQTLPGATVVESGDVVPNGSRVVPISAILTLDLDAAPPSLTAVFSNAVLEGREPIELTVRSSSGARLMDGKYWFTGDYLRDLYPSGTQYGFNWRFSASTNGEVVWNGHIGWWGGRLWDVTISNLTIVPKPRLEIGQAGSKVTVSWLAAHAGYVLERAAALPAAEWTTVTNSVEIIGDRSVVAVEAGSSQEYFRLRRL
jgi:hypothetical protein